MVGSRPIKVFESHTKLDSKFCDAFDRACARVGIDAFRSEYEGVKPPAWKTIRDELRQSKALFLLVGKALVKAQSKHSAEWEHTQNWISYEIGIACDLGIDIWVICDDVAINFPVPYFNIYVPYSIRRQDNFQNIVRDLQRYASGNEYDVRPGSVVTCTYKGCRIKYNLPATVAEGREIVCPCCLQIMTFPKGHPLKK